MIKSFGRRDLRLGSGVVLFAYVATHLANHALGLVSLAAAERGLRIGVAVWQSPPGTLLLYGAAVTHVALAFIALYERRTLRIPPLELLRIALGFGIPTLLIGHAINTRLAFEIYGHPPDYAHVVWALWHSGREGLQIALLVPGWLHGCLGLRYAFGRRTWFAGLRPLLFAGALLLPVLAVTGFLSMAREVALLAQDPSWVAVTAAEVAASERLALAQIGRIALLGYFSAVGIVLVSRIVRSVVERGRGRLISIRYPQQTIRVPRGWTVLEASRSHHIAHQSTCGGQGRCSTCRVQVVAGLAHCPPPSAAERATLARIGASDATRLACQLRPQADIDVVPLLAPSSPPAPRDAVTGSMERDVALMLVVLRRRATPGIVLPHDLLYALDRYCETVGHTVRASHGVPGAFTGERVTVLFGLDCVPREASRQALRAAAELDRRLERFRARLSAELGWATEHAIYLHAGVATIGEIGDRTSRTTIAVGTPVDAIQRLVADDDRAAAPTSAGHARIVASQAIVAAARGEASDDEWTRLSPERGGSIDVARLDAAQATRVAR